MSNRSKPTTRPAWSRRLYLPAYRYAEAARLAQTTPQALSQWYRASSAPRHQAKTLPRSGRAGLLSYMQLVEIVFVADFRRLGVPLQRLRQAHAYLRKAFEVEYPFAHQAIEAEGVYALAEFTAYEVGGSVGGRLLAANGGQPAWPDAIRKRFDQFDYEDGLALRWHPRGRDSAILIDPRIAFGAPIVAGTGVATWMVRERYEAGESFAEIEEDLGVSRQQIEQALTFEGIPLAAA